MNTYCEMIIPENEDKPCGKPAVVTHLSPSGDAFPFCAECAGFVINLNPVIA